MIQTTDNPRGKKRKAFIEKLKFKIVKHIYPIDIESETSELNIQLNDVAAHVNEAYSKNREDNDELSHLMDAQG